MGLLQNNSIFDFIEKVTRAHICAPFKIILKDGIEYKYRKIKGAKNLRIRVQGSNKVLITLPFRCTFNEAKDFVQSKTEWIKDELEKATLGRIEENFKTKSGNLIITTGFFDTPKTVVKKGVVQFFYPIGADFYSYEIQKSACLAVKKALKIEAKDFLPKRLENLAQKFGFKYNKIALKTSKTRWGSCSYRNNINLNINLMALDYELIDYVLLHELCHTVEKNHGEGFWALLEKCIPNAKSLKLKIKKEKMIV